MARTNVVTGAASGIGRATQELLEQRGETVFGVDLVGSDVVMRGDSTW
jgi:NADP-dependent 3-hydroxy acid dehydrogenase YdfG